MNAEQAVIVTFHYGSKDLTPVFALEEQIEAAIAKASAGEYDGNEFSADGTEGVLYMYGPDGDRLFDAIRPVLEASPILKGAKVRIRYGLPGKGAAQRDVIIGGAG